MLKKIKEFFSKIQSALFLTLNLILILLIAEKIFFYFRDVKLFENVLYNSITLTLFYIGVYLFLINFYYKLFKFESKKDLLTESELKELIKEKAKYSKKILRKENRSPKASTKKLNQLIKEGKEINKKLDKGIVSFKSYIVFLLFSIYYGTYVGLPIWSIKNSIKYFPKAFKNFFKLKIDSEYIWDKFVRNKEVHYYLYSR